MPKTTRVLLPVILSILLISGVKSAGAQPSCQPILLKPALIDSDGNGPTPGTDGTITPQLCPGTPETIQIPNPWENCNGSGAGHDYFEVTFDPSTNHILTISRDRGNSHTEEIVPTYDAQGNPISFTMTASSLSKTLVGTATLIKDAHGNFSGISFGPPINLELDFVFHFGSDGQPDYMSLPWGQMGALGVKSSTNCSPPVGDGSTPQIWVPLVNGGVDVDPTLPGAPPTTLVFSRVAPPIPTLSKGMAIVMALSILLLGLFQIRRTGLGF